MDMTREEIAEVVRLHGLWLKGEPAGRKANLSGADLSEADLTWADLSGADLRRADLSGADLREADLSKARLTGADLSEANMSKARLIGAGLRKARLSGADLTGADLIGADLSGADLPEAPLVSNLDGQILAAIAAGGALDMASWHACGTTHCRAGWAITLAGEAGRELEHRLGPNVAGALIYARAYPDLPVPDFFATNEAALADIQTRAVRG
jgi:uncharacterized protein YjbI with pentapeptide repeats